MLTKEQGRAKVDRLVDRFRSRLRELRSPATSEAMIRQEFLDPFWEALGWDVRNKGNKSVGERDVLIEAGLDTIEDKRFRHRRCDYFFRLSGFPRFLLEAKKPAVEADDPDAIFQTKTYAWNAKIPFAVLSNFEDFRLFDSTVTPSRAHPTRGMIRDFKLGYEDYLSQWDALWDTFSREAVESGSLDKLFAKEKKVRAGRRVRSADRMLFDIRGTAQVDQVFLAHLQNYRERFANALYRENRESFRDADTRQGAANLTEATQRLLDRLVFIRVCEDRDIMPYGRLLKLLTDCKPAELYGRLLDVFRELDAKYNGYLFKPHPLSEALDVDGTLLGGFIRSLYTPEGPYCFDRIGDDILGIIYERFLGSVIEVKSGRVTAEQKPEVRHAGGVYYTPRFVVDSIIRRVIGPKIEGKSPKEVLKVKVLDPACGSGSFLIAAFDYLMEHCRRYVAANPDAAVETIERRKHKVAFKDAAGVWHLSPEFRARLLTACIHGVDIDHQAVEVTVMSLYIKMLEGQFPPNWQQDFLNQRLLPALDNNIRCGNSLIDPDELADHLDNINGPLFGGLDPDTQFRINPFAWRSTTRGFGRVFDQAQGFDCIIGNPPYIRVQELNKYAKEECEFFKVRYASCAAGGYDIYVAFLERGLELLAPKGLMGYICPHRFWKAQYGANIRQVVSSGRHLLSVVDFGHQQVFVDATTYTAIHVLSKARNTRKIDYARVHQLTDGFMQLAALDSGGVADGCSRFLVDHPGATDLWVLVPKRIATWLKKVRTKGRPLEAITGKIAQGIVTSKDSVFFLTGSSDACVSKETGRTYKLEKEVVHPLLKGSVHMKRWAPLATDRVVIFPYEKHERQWRLIPEGDFHEKYPATWAYLQENREVLEARESGKMRGRADWYGYVYPKNREVMGAPKILVPSIATKGEYCLDAKGEQYFVGSGGGGGGGYAVVPSINIDLAYLCGLLNSRLLDDFLRTITAQYEGGWCDYSPGFIGQIPVLVPKTGKENGIARRITKVATRLTELMGKLRNETLGANERERIEREVDATERQLDKLVCTLYGVDLLPELAPQEGS